VRIHGTVFCGLHNLPVTQSPNSAKNGLNYKNVQLNQHADPALSVTLIKTLVPIFKLHCNAHSMMQTIATQYTSSLVCLSIGHKPCKNN